MPEASTFRDLLRVRAANADGLGRLNKGYGSALGRKNLDGPPAVLVFVERKIHERWLSKEELVPKSLEGPEGIWCPTDIVQVGGELQAPDPPMRLERKQLALRERLRGAHDRLSPGSQLGFQRINGEPGLGTLAAFARCRSTGQLGLLTNAHVGTAVGNVLTHPEQRSPVVARVARRMESIPLAQRLEDIGGDGYGHFVMDCAFAALSSCLDPEQDLDFNVPWVDASVEPPQIRESKIGPPLLLDLDDPSLSPIGRKVFAVGRTQSDQAGVIRGFAYEHVDGEHVAGYTDYLVASEEGQYFSQPGDSGKLIMTNDYQPVGLLWGGGLLRTDVRYELADHSFAVDINIVLQKLDIDVITEAADLRDLREDDLTASLERG